MSTLPILLLTGLSALPAVPDARELEPPNPSVHAAGEARDANPPSRYAQGWKKMTEEDKAKLHSDEIWFEETKWTDGSQSYAVRVGPKGERIDWDEFYRRVGRPDYAENYQTRALAKDIMWWANLVVVTGGFCGGVALCGSGAAIGVVLGSTSGVFLAAGGVLLVSGVALGMVAAGVNSALLIIPGFIDDWPVTIYENYELAEAYNERLLQGGAPDQGGPPDQGLKARAPPVAPTAFAPGGRMAMAF